MYALTARKHRTWQQRQRRLVFPNDKLEFIKNPVVAEFLGFSQNTDFTESDLEKSILSNLQKFLMELGKGYAFVARQQHIHTEKQDYYIDLGTGLRVGEVTGLRWCDIDLEDGIIDVNHTLVYYDHRTSEGKKGCYFNVNTPKTEAGNRQVPMLDFVKEAFVMEKERQELLGVHCEATIDGYTDFIFLNRFGQPQHQSTLNKAIRRIIRDCNDEQFLKTENPEVLLPHFSCHSLRHTFTTRMCEAGVNIKVIQDTLGHKDITTTLNIYTDVTKELKRTEFDGLDKYFNNSIA